MITKLEPSEIFVFGSNLAGVHGAGAALQARRQFGARLGIGEGRTGQTYAFPTLDENLQKRNIADIELSRDALFRCCAEFPYLRFLLTKVGCGLAGYPEAQMRALFTEHPENLILPEDWR